MTPSEVIKKYDWTTRHPAIDTNGKWITAKGNDVAANPDKYNVAAVDHIGAMRLSHYNNEEHGKIWDILAREIRKDSTFMKQTSHKQSTNVWESSGKPIFSWFTEPERTKEEVIALFKLAEKEIDDTN